MLTVRSCLVLALVVLAGPAPAADVARLSGPARVVDGDTLVIGAEHIRLYGIDAPEHDQTCTAAGAAWDCGLWAGQALSALVKGREVACTGLDRDRYGRLVARCRVGGADLGAALVAQGAATAYRRYSLDYVGAEDSARRAGLGIWRGTVEAPETFRHETFRHEAAATESAPPGACAIKGNISNHGRIYHLPGQEHYANTRIDPKRGEAWFCTEAEARAAGFRKAKQ